MPEGPEVERVRRSLEPWVVGAAVVAVRIARRDVVITERDPAGGVSRQRAGAPARQRPVRREAMLVGDRITAVQRRGKQLAMLGESGRAVLVHLGMTGRLVAEREEAARALPHTHVGWTLERSGQRARLRFVDPRRFGGVWTLPSPEALRERWDALGPDAASVRASDLAAAIAASARSIKSALLDQRVVAGVGNIYADESLFKAGLRPRREAKTLTADEVERLAGAIRRVIGAAVEAGGSTIRDYVDADGTRGGAQLMHQVYGRGGEPCVRCGAALETAVIGQRTTVWCGACQR